MGDGVNITSRIQSVTDKSDISISGKVYSDIKNKEGLEAEFLGEHELKGLKTPVGVYKINCLDEGLLDYTIDTNNLFAFRSLLTGYEGNGDYDKWIELWKQVILWDEETEAFIEKTFREQGYDAAKVEIVNTMEKWFEENSRTPYLSKLTTDYIKIGEFNKAVELMEIIYENRDSGLTYMTTWGSYEQMKDNPGYISLLKKMNLPLP